MNTQPFRDEISRDIREVFVRADSGAKGHLNRDELLVAFVGVLGYRPSAFELEQIDRTIRIDHGEMTLKAFTGLVLPRMSVDTSECIRQMFLALDTQSHGYISLADLMRAAREFAPLMAGRDEEGFFEEVFGIVDRDSDGKIGFRDFDALMRLGVGAT